MPDLADHTGEEVRFGEEKERKKSSTLGEEIAHLRKKSNLSQNELAQKIGVSRQMVSLWERGIFLPDEEHFQAICKAFDLPDDYFLR